MPQATYALRVTRLVIGQPNVQVRMEKGNYNKEIYGHWRWHHLRPRRHHRYNTGGRANSGPTEPPKYGVKSTKKTSVTPRRNAREGGRGQREWGIGLQRHRTIPKGLGYCSTSIPSYA